MFDKINLKFILNHQIDIIILINYNYDKWGRVTIEVIHEQKNYESN